MPAHIRSALTTTSIGIPYDDGRLLLGTWQGLYLWELGLSAVQVASAFLGAAFLDPWLQGHRLFSAEPLGLLGGVVVGYLGITFLWYWWHRARHASPLLWRTLHQVHHSPSRLELLTTSPT